MGKLTMFVQAGCPYCKRALAYWEELKQEAKYQAIEIELIDELREADLAATYDYYYVPTIFFKGKKLHEGALERAGLKVVLDVVIEDDE